MPRAVRSGLREPLPERLFARCTARFTGGEFQRAPAHSPMGRPLARRLSRLNRVEAAGVTVRRASGLLSRTLGLAFLDRELAGEGLLIPDCRSVHTFGMRFSLDLVFLGPDGAAVRIERCVPPGRLLFEPSAESVVELPSGFRPRHAASSKGARMGAGRA